MESLDKEIMNQKLGAIGQIELGLKDGKIIAEIELSPKMIMDGLAAKIGGPLPAEIALFFETAFGLK